MENSAPMLNRVFPTPTERLVLLISCTLVVVDVFLLWTFDTQIAAHAYIRTGAIMLGCLGIATFYELTGRSPNIALGLRCVSLLIFFSAAAACYNYLMMPTKMPAIDHLLVWIDSLYGYHWPDVIEFAANHPWINAVVRFGYAATLPQLAVLVAILGMTGRRLELQKLLLCLVLTALFSISFWGIFPTHGAKSLFVLDPAIESLAAPSITTAYGAELVRMAKEGADLITPDDMKGLIGFPSFHAVMACLGIWYSRTLRWLFPIYLAINLLVLPGAPMHGGHHFIDVPAGILVFIAGAFLAHRLVERMEKPVDVSENSTTVVNAT